MEQDEKLWFWEWEDYKEKEATSKWYLFDQKSIDCLEQAHAKHEKTIELGHDHFGKQGGYIINLEKMKQIKKSTNFTRSIRRIQLSKTQIESRYVWEWKNDKKHWVEFAPEVSQQFERGYRSDNSDLTLSVNSKNYLMNFCTFTQLNLVTRFRRDIRRVPMVNRKPLKTPELLEGLLLKKTPSFLGKVGLSNDYKLYKVWQKDNFLHFGPDWKTTEEKLDILTITKSERIKGNYFLFYTPKAVWELCTCNSVSDFSDPSYWINGIINFKNEDQERTSNDIESYYTFGKILGSGAFGQVRVVTGKTTQKKFAAKIIDKKKFTNPKEQELIQRETEVMKRLNHSNIVKLFETFESIETLYIVMELIEGGELYNVILAKAEKKEFFSEKEAQSIIGQTLKGLAYCHSKKIAHRDIKPQNILTTSRIWPFTIKITDWGFARELDEVKGVMETYCGTPLFMGPEMFLGGYDGFKADIWALGIIFYIIFCGYPPFGIGGDIISLFLSKLQPLDFPTQEWSSVSKEAKDLISKMLEQHSSNRPSAKECLQHPFFKIEIKNVLNSFNREKFRELNLGKNPKLKKKYEDFKKQDLENTE